MEVETKTIENLISELEYLNRSHVLLETIWCHLNPNKKRRQVVVPQELLNSVKEHILKYPSEE